MIYKKDKNIRWDKYKILAITAIVIMTNIMKSRPMNNMKELLAIETHLINYIKLNNIKRYGAT